MTPDGLNLRQGESDAAIHPCRTRGIPGDHRCVVIRTDRLVGRARPPLTQ
jgi:hypothetical protein